MKISALPYILTLFTATASAETMIISDIDDTIRQTNVVEKPRAAGNLLNGIKSFDRMREIFSEMKSVDSKLKIFYVSGSPEFLDPKAWVEENHFPKGEVHAKSFLTFLKGVGTQEHKKDSIKKIFSAYAEEHDLKKLTVYAFGDNGEHDPEIYLNAQEDFPQVNFKVFIRDIQAEATDFGPLLPAPRRVPGFHYFLTEADLLKTREFEGWLTQDFVQRLCRDFRAEAWYREGYDPTQRTPDFLISEFVRWEIRGKVNQACASKPDACRDAPNVDVKYQSLLEVYIEQTLSSLKLSAENYRPRTWAAQPIPGK